MLTAPTSGAGRMSEALGLPRASAFYRPQHQRLSHVGRHPEPRAKYPGLTVRPRRHGDRYFPDPHTRLIQHQQNAHVLIVEAARRGAGEQAYGFGIEYSEAARQILAGQPRGHAHQPPREFSQDGASLDSRANDNIAVPCDHGREKGGNITRIVLTIGIHRHDKVEVLAGRLAQAGLRRTPSAELAGQPNDPGPRLQRDGYGSIGRAIVY